MKYIIRSLKKIPLWRFIVTGILLLGLSLEDSSNFLYQKIQPSFQEMMITTFGSHFSLYIIFLLMIADLGFDHGNDETNKNMPRFFGCYLGYFAFLSFLYILCLPVCNFTALLLKSGAVTFSEELINVQLYGLEWMPASLAMAINILLLYLCFVFIAAVVFIVNGRCKKRPLGYLGLLAICILDVTVYKFAIFPVGVFPSEYASAESALLVTSNITLNIAISIFYWLFLISMAGLVYHIINKRKAPERGN